MNLRSVIAGIIFMLLLALQAQAQFFRINTIGCKLKDEDLATLNRMGKFEATFYNQVFKTNKNDSVTVNINLYGSRRDYNQVQRDAMNTTFIDGFYSPADNRVYMYKSDRFMNTLFHETSHNLLHYNIRNPPQWLSEGIATLLGFLVETTDGQVLYMPQHGYIKQVRDSISAHQFNFGSYFNYRPADWTNKDKRPMLYAVAYSLVFFFINQKKDHLTPILVNIQHGDSTAGALRKEFGSLENFSQEFYNYYFLNDGRAF